MMISPIWALLSYVGEWATRVPMVVDDVDMTGQRAIITGACVWRGSCCPVEPAAHIALFPHFKLLGVFTCTAA